MSKKVFGYLFLVSVGVNALLGYYIHAQNKKLAVQEHYRREAFGRIHALYRGSSFRYSSLQNAEVELQEVLAGGGLTLEDVGMTQHALKELVIDKATNDAIQYLHALRRGCGLGSCYNEIREYLRIADRKPWEIGTSEVEIRVLTVKSFQEYTDLLRNIHAKGEKIEGRYMTYFKKVVQEAGYELTDANTTEEDLRSFSK